MVLPRRKPILRPMPTADFPPSTEENGGGWSPEQSATSFKFLPCNCSFDWWTIAAGVVPWNP
jgi:hypothetical protein